MSTPFSFLQNIQIWQVAIAVGMVLMLIGSGVLVYKIFKREYKRTTGVISEYLEKYLGEFIKGNHIKAAKGINPTVKGKIGGTDVILQFTIKPHGLKSIYIESMEDISLWTLRVKMPDKDKMRMDQRKKVLEGLVQEYGGKVTTSKNWVYWYAPKKDPKEQLEQLLKKITREVR